MGSILGFNEHLQDDVVKDNSQCFKIVPWISWDEWNFVRESIFNSSPDSVASALRRISTWRSRGCIPVAIEVTASIVGIQQKDPYFRIGLNDNTCQSEEMLAMLYCMAIMRLVNGLVEKTRKKNEISIGEAADAIGIPRMLIDIRHEGSHRDLPSLPLVRLASNKALDWLVSYYWEPQEKAIPLQNNQIANLRKEIKRGLREVALCLKAKQIARSSYSHVKGKRVRHAEHLYGCNKFLFLAAGKPSHSNSTGSKKQLAKSLKNTLRLYSSFSSEVVYILLEYLLNALDSSNFEKLEDSETENKQTAFDDWKCVVLKLSRKDPEFLLTLTHAVLEKMETNDAVDCDIDDDQTPRNSTKSCRIELLSYLLTWLIGNLKTLNPLCQKDTAESKNSKTEKHLPEATLLALLRRCLLISSSGNKQLMKSALTLSQLTGNGSLQQKLKKLVLLEQLPNSEAKSVDSCNDETPFFQQEYSIRQAEEKFELIRSRMKGKCGKPSQSDEVGVKRKWAVTKSWNLCPIGMLPSKIGFSGQLPVLDYVDEVREIMPLSDCKKDCKVNLGKREAESGVEKMDNWPAKKLETETNNVMQDQDDVSGGVKGRLMIDGLWREVGEEEVFAIASAVKLLV